MQNYTKYEQKEKRFNQGRCSLASKKIFHNLTFFSTSHIFV
ncbi:hypothetical protein MNB_SM-7-294 [hydrothermal vent metagenome]|uniref:Uncharacterized protein n=1 Tax=hydrothermal vent metagenome TaxID=652676 RepID=A0A1W1BCQ8_9ZZZZ